MLKGLMDWERSCLNLRGMCVEFRVEFEGDDILGVECDVGEVSASGVAGRTGILGGTDWLEGGVTVMGVGDSETVVRVGAESERERSGS